MFFKSRIGPNELNEHGLRRLNGAPIEIQHDPPKSLTERGFESLAHEEDFFFERFEAFGRCVNRPAGNLFRIQERRDNSISGFDTPQYGRRYRVFFGRLETGGLELWADPFEKIAVRVSIGGVPATSIRFQDMYSYLQLLAKLIADPDKSDQFSSTSEYDAAINAIHMAMLETVWNMQSYPDQTSELEVSFSGSAGTYDRVKADWATENNACE